MSPGDSGVLVGGVVGASVVVGGVVVVDGVGALVVVVVGVGALVVVVVLVVVVALVVLAAVVLVLAGAFVVAALVVVTTGVGEGMFGVSAVKIDSGDVVAVGVGVAEPVGVRVEVVELFSVISPAPSSPSVALAARGSSGPLPEIPTISMNASTGSVIIAAPMAEPSAIRRGHTERGARCVPTYRTSLNPSTSRQMRDHR